MEEEEEEEEKEEEEKAIVRSAPDGSDNYGWYRKNLMGTDR